MKALLIATGLLIPAFGQTDAALKFEAADIHVSPKAASTGGRGGGQFARGSVVKDRYVIKNASIVDLIRMSTAFDNDHIFGGPQWLEMDRFDITAKMPEKTTPDDRKAMLRNLLADRFALVTHEDSKPMPSYSLTVPKKANLKEADGSGETGCRPQTGGSNSGPGTIRLMTGTPDGRTSTIILGQDGAITFACKNMTMKSFAEGLRGMMGANLPNNTPVNDETGLEGRWNFDVHWTIGLIGLMGQSGGSGVSVFDALEKQLGLKLVEKQVPTPVIVVDSVKRKPSPNPPGTDDALPAAKLPTEFEVASVKQVEMQPNMMRRTGFQGGRFTVQGMPLSFLITRAFNATTRDTIVGLPQFADTTLYDVMAEASADGGVPLDNDTVGPLILALLKDRFKLAYHTEERQISAYALTAGKPKMKKANPENRTRCTDTYSPPGAPPGTRVMTCQNISMEEFAERLQYVSQELTQPVSDLTELNGRWDFALSFNPNAGRMMPQMRAPEGGGGGGASQTEVPVAQDAMQGYTLFEAIEKQLGLKLVPQKRTGNVIVIDHIEQKPTEN